MRTRFLQWYNPHVRMQIRVETDNGASEIWDMEAMDVNSLDRAGVPRDLVEVGQTVTIAGTPSSRRPRALLLTNLMLPDGRELLTHVSGVPRWSEPLFGVEPKNLLHPWMTSFASSPTMWYASFA